MGRPVQLLGMGVVNEDSSNCRIDLKPIRTPYRKGNHVHTSIHINVQVRVWVHVYVQVQTSLLIHAGVHAQARVQASLNTCLCPRGGHPVPDPAPTSVPFPAPVLVIDPGGVNQDWENQQPLLRGGIGSSHSAWPILWSACCSCYAWSAAMHFWVDEATQGLKLPAECVHRDLNRWYELYIHFGCCISVLICTLHCKA